MNKQNETQIMTEQVSMQIIMRIRQIIQEMSKYSKYILENYNVTVPQLICLHEVYQHGPISIGALTKIIFLNNSTVTGIVDRLEKREFVKRVRISKDRRQIHLEVTEQGINFIQKAPKPLQDQFIDRLKSLDKEKITLILWSLEMLVDLFGKKQMKMEIPTPPIHVTQLDGMTNIEYDI
ncbi:MAG: MarR family transcriptional regulator [Deltaproteobacteria bacterium]|jgi:DNA-binding MarR family transcriptional regulator|nr:MarR family transcriptional regulator [Deltaproteobacteria bacterium]